MAQEPAWPSVQEQLAAARARRGSALEKLISENQDFGLLAPEEARDNAGLPLWLRVFWRKGHPDVPHSTENPGAGYPDVLYTIHAWMVAHPDNPLGPPRPGRTRGGRR